MMRLPHIVLIALALVAVWMLYKHRGKITSALAK